MEEKEVFRACSKARRVESEGARMSRLNVTREGTVLVLEGERVRMPVLASEECAVARLWEWMMHWAVGQLSVGGGGRVGWGKGEITREAVSRASDR